MPCLFPHPPALERLVALQRSNLEREPLSKQGLLAWEEPWAAVIILLLVPELTSLGSSAWWCVAPPLFLALGDHKRHAVMSLYTTVAP